MVQCNVNNGNHMAALSAGNGQPRLTPQGVNKIMEDTERMFKLLDKQIAINSDIIHHLADICM